MNSISSLKNVHKLGLFGDHNDKNENQIIKISIGDSVCHRNQT